MIGSALDKVTGFIGPRMVLTALLPSIAFWSAILALLVTVNGGTASTKLWNGFTAQQQTLISIGAVAGLVFFATLVTVQSDGLIRLYEGYWGTGRIGDWLTAPGKALQRWRRNRLQPNDKEADFEKAFRWFPRQDQAMLPTRLGNALKAAEQYPGDGDRYGIDAVFFWPRLYEVMPSDTRDDLAEARSLLDMMVLVSALGVAFTASGIVILWISGSADLRLWLTTAGGGLLVAFLAYRSAVRRALTYGELVRSCFDLYRLDLLKQLGFCPPQSLAAERELWKALGQQLYRREAEHPELLRYRQ